MLVASLACSAGILAAENESAAPQAPAETGKSAVKKTVNTVELANRVKLEIKKDPKRLLEIVASEIKKDHEHACEIVKAAIVGSDVENISTIASIVRTAATVLPESMRLCAQCAVATNPDSLAAVQSVLAELDPATGNKGNGSKDSKDAKDAGDAKDSKSAKVEEVAPKISDPLNLPPGVILPPSPPPIYMPPPPVTTTETGFRR
ncbi:MAG: hypothetical protein QM755_06300 [Luteolibacter sp.]